MKRILLSLLLIGQVFGQQIINNDGGTTIDGNLTVATNVSVGGNITMSANGKLIYPLTGTFSLVTSPTSISVSSGYGGNVVLGSGLLSLGSYTHIKSEGDRIVSIVAPSAYTSPNTLRTYGTYTDASNYERISMAHDGSGTGTIGVESSGTGSADQSLKIQLAGNGALYVDGDTAGNARGVNAVDLQVSRSAASMVASGAISMIGGGINNIASGSRSTVSGGSSSTASGQYSTVGGGGVNSASGESSTIAGGFGHFASGKYSTIAGGYYANAYLYGQHAFASGYFAANGDAQGSRLVMRNTTTGSSADLFLDGSSARAVIPANTTWMFEITVSARSTDGGSGGEESAAYKYIGCIERDGAGNTALVGTVGETVVAEDDTDWSVVVSADDTNDALDINVTSDDANTVRWVAVVTLTEVGG